MTSPKARFATLFALVLVAVSVAALSAAGRAYAPPTPTFSDISAGLTGVESGSVAWGDYTGDGKLDILITGEDYSAHPIAKLYKNNGNGTFSEDTTADSVLTPVEYGSAAWGDYNNDGRLDILLSGCPNSACSTIVTKLYRNNGNGTFSEDTTAESGLAGVWDSSVAWGDYNSDGKPDILLTGCPSSACSVPIAKLYKNNGNGSFSEDTTAESALAGVYFSSVAWGDYNLDGRPDILLNGTTTSQPITKLCTNNGNGSFSENTTADSVLTGAYVGSVAWGDYNLDGRPDILLTGVTNSGEVAAIYKNNGDGSFSEDTTADGSLTPVLNGSAAWGDYNADGKPDIVLTGEASGSVPVSKIYSNNGSTFSEDATASAGLAPVEYSSAAWGDYNSDGKLDALIAGDTGSGYLSSVYQNGLSAADTAPAAPAHLSAKPVSGSNVTLSWDVASDAQQAGGAGLSYNLRVGTTPGGSDVVAPMALASGTRLVPQVGNVGERTSYTLTGLTPGAAYYWSVQAIDSSFAGSAFATEGSFQMAPIFAFSSSKYSVGEAHGPATIKINRSNLIAASASVHFSTTNGSAKASSDYTSVSKTVTFAAGVTQMKVSVPIKNDKLPEKNETVRLSLSGPSTGATLGTPHTATLTIIDNDHPGKLSSAKLSKTSFPSSQAGTVKLSCKFSPTSRLFAYVLSVKKGKRWAIVNSVRKTGSFKTYTATVKRLFTPKPVTSGSYRLKISADANSKTLGFKVT
ncbi:MAG: FG-GAP-like repeat-containing protein [Gaiellaceae bacterium]